MKHENWSNGAISIYRCARNKKVTGV